MALKLSTSNVMQVPVKDLLPDPDQPREIFDKTALNMLAINIKERGIQVPLLVRIRSTGKVNEILIKDGERRWRAAKLAKLKTVPVLLAHTGDATQIRLDQVTVNEMREGLRPMEMARTLHKMQTVDKLSINEIAARLLKQGVAINAAGVANLVKLVELPQWAQDMVNGEQLEITAAREIAGIADKPVLAKLEKNIRQQLNWRGRVTVKETQDAIRDSYCDVGQDLKRTESYRSDAVRFDYKKVCKECPHLRETHGAAYCMNEALFKQHQAEAKEAGLEFGGKKIQASKASVSKEKPATPAQQKKQEAEKAKQRAGALEDKSAYYLHDWARRRILAHLPISDGTTAQRLVEFAAAHRPGIDDHAASHVEHQRNRSMRSAAAVAGYPTMVHFLQTNDSGGKLYEGLAMELVRQLPLIETLNVAHHLFGSDLSTLWKVDAEYLDLLQKAELAQVAEKHATLPEGSKSWGALKADQLKASILAVADQVGVPPVLAKLYAKPDVREPEELDDDDLDDTDDDTGDE